MPGLFHAFWASAIALHCLAETLDGFETKVEVIESAGQAQVHPQP